MRYKIFIYLVTGLIFICASCSNKQYLLLFQKKNALNDSTYANAPVVSEYRIKSQDILRVRNLQTQKYLVNTTPSTAVNTNLLNGNAGSANNANANQENNDDNIFQVEQDGSVILPALGHIQVAGYTRLEAQKIIEDAYRKNVLVNPIIELKIVNLKVTLFGEVKTQGDVPLNKEHTTLVEVIGSSGGVTDKADQTDVEIIRGTEKNPKIISIDLSDIHAINDPRAVLQNGDIIYVRQNRRAAKAENYSSTTTTIFQPALLLINTALIIFTLIHR